jgi:hypothetical protein
LGVLVSQCGSVLYSSWCCDTSITIGFKKRSMYLFI